ncbi:hypothetical protein ACSSS7_005347 [Eimeria intestinalis]
MAFPGLFLVAAASLVLLDSTAAMAEDNAQIKHTDANTCLEKMNEARRKAKLADLGTYTPERVTAEAVDADGIWKDVCRTLLEADQEDTLKRLSDPVSSEVYAVLDLRRLKEDLEGETAATAHECSTAVEAWQKGFKAFEGDPPVIREGDYANATAEQLSFVTLYNPNKEAKGYCSVATCTSSPLRRSPKTKAVSLVCLTDSNPFKDSKHFQKEAWDNIKNALATPEEEQQKVTISCLRHVVDCESLCSNPSSSVSWKLKVAQEVYKCTRRRCLLYCLYQGVDFKPSVDNLDPSRTFAVFKLREESEKEPVEKQQKKPTDAQCSAAVEEWQQGFRTFEADPPVDKRVEYSAATSRQISFVTLYNPDSQAKGQCSVATCTLSKATGEVKKTAIGLVCSSSPQVFGEEVLFTQNQWDNIKSVLLNSSPATGPSIVAFSTLVVAALLS